MHEPSEVVFFSGGGTGGHLYPALALADALGSLRPGLRAVFVGAERGVEARILPDRGVEHLLVPIRGFHRGRGLATQLGVVPALLRSVGRLAGAFQRYRPELVVVTGGYAGAPAGLMAVVSGVPLVLQEQNAVPGITTRLLAPFARQIHLAFPEAGARLSRRARRRIELNGNPVRPPEARDAAADRAAFGLDPRRPVVLVVGGSQGSQALNDAFVRLVTDRDGSDPGYQLLWSTGPSHIAAVEAALAGCGSPAWVKVLGYIDPMPAALSAADVAVSRAGAMATSEFLAWGLPSVLVPLPTAAADHQTRNAEALAAAGAALHVAEDTLPDVDLDAKIRGLFADPETLMRLARAGLERGRPESARDIATRLATLLPRRAAVGRPA